MRKPERVMENDLEECRLKIIDLLIKYNCDLESSEMYGWVLIRDLDTNETLNCER